MKAQLAVLWIVALRLFSFEAQVFEVSGRLSTATQASVSLHSTSTPFAISKLSDPGGRFRFERVEAGTYTLIVFIPGRGELRRTIDVGPGSADGKGRVTVTVDIDEGRLTADRQAKVSVNELAVPERARREYAAADRSLAKNDGEAAAAHLKKAVEIAPGFSAAWNHLGTIAYKSQSYDEAADCFRKALVADPSAYEPLVNLGGVLLNLGKIEEAWSYNVHAVLKRPDDALANSQLGMTYFEMRKPSLAVKYLEAARRLDPGHFSHPQLLLAEIYLRRKQNSQAADVLEEFLKYHPDWPKAATMREAIEKLRQ